MVNARDPNTDLLRALAIGMVLVHHVCQAIGSLSPQTHSFTALGAFGVDLFFVLSGWLIGGLYWREQRSTGKVELWRFWSRRWLRTIPPYLVVLPFAYVAVLIARREPFDWRYLMFLQNYEERIPFFLVSWSLCVEEHFYLVLPLLLGVLGALRMRPGVALLILWSVACLARVLDPRASVDAPFGYAHTASHLRLDGLLMGVWLAWAHAANEVLWQRLQTVASWMALPLLAAMLTMPTWPAVIAYQTGPAFISIVFATLLTAVVGKKAIVGSRSPVVQKIALWSYSVYLTHALVLHAVTRGTAQVGGVHPVWWATISLITILATGWVMHAFVERPSMLLRDRWIPRGDLVNVQR